MTGSLAVDVAIGLIVIYLLYSLLVSILGEMVSTGLDLRARLLRFAIERMFNDDSPSSLQSFFLAQSKSFDRSLAGKFYDQPSIRFLAKRDKHGILSLTSGKPPYVTADNFADTMIYLFRERGQGAQDINKVAFCLMHNTLLIEVRTLTHLRNLLDDSQGDIAVFKSKLRQWFNETMDRATGWYKRKLQMILLWLGLIIAIAFNVDSIELAQHLASDSSVRKDMVQIGIQASSENSPVYKALQNAKDSAAADSLLINSFRDLKKSRDQANKILGLGWDFAAMKCDTLVKTYPDKAKTTEQKKVIDSLATLRRKIILLIEKPDVGVFAQTKIDSLYKIYSALIPQLSGWTNAEKAAVFQIGGTHTINDQTLAVAFDLNPTFGGKLLYVLSRSFGDPLKLTGLIITALMLSLGAPFWFDILRKVVVLRGAGVSPDEKAPEKKQGPDTGQSVTGQDQELASQSRQTISDNVQLALAAVREQVLEMPEVLRVMDGLEEIKGAITRVIEIHVLKGPDIIAAVKTKLGANAEVYGTVPIIYLENEPAKSHLAPGDSITNTKSQESGTLGMFCRKGSDITKCYLASCWHVLNPGKNTAPITPADRIIADGRRNVIGTFIDGTINNKVDVGFAELLKNEGSNSDIHITKIWREVTGRDSLTRSAVTFKGANSGIREAVIYKHSDTAALDYDGLQMNFEDIIYITRFESGKRTAPSTPGDSGAVVVDAEGAPIGLVIGGDQTYTYVSKLSNIFREHSFKDYTIILK